MSISYLGQQFITITITVAACFLDWKIFRGKLSLREPDIRKSVKFERSNDNSRKDNSMPTTEAMVFAMIPYTLTLLAFGSFKLNNFDIKDPESVYTLLGLAILPFCGIIYIFNLIMHKNRPTKTQDENDAANRKLKLDMPFAITGWIMIFIFPLIYIHWVVG